MFRIGDRIVINNKIESVGYIQLRKWYSNCFSGMTGKIIGFTADGSKAAVEFDQIVFFDHKTKRSSHDNGCHGRGKLHYCWYIPIKCIDFDYEPSFPMEQEETVDLTINKKLLLL